MVMELSHQPNKSRLEDKDLLILEERRRAVQVFWLDTLDGNDLMVMEGRRG